MSDELKRCPFCGGEAHVEGARTRLADLICDTDGATQKSVADAVGCCPQSVAKMEHWPAPGCSRRIAEGLADYFGTTPDALFERSRWFKGIIVCGGCGATARNETAWNTRAAVTDEQFATAVHDGEAWKRVRECRMSHARGGGWYCSGCGVWVAPGPMANATEHLAPRYCPNCGAKVAPC